MEPEQQKTVDIPTEEMAEIEVASPALLKELYDLALLVGVETTSISDDVWLDFGKNLKIRLSQDGLLYIQASAHHPCCMTESAFSKSGQQPVYGGCKFTSKWGIRSDGNFVGDHEDMDSWSIESISFVRTKCRNNPTKSKPLDKPPVAENVRKIIQNLQGYKTKVIKRETESAVEATLVDLYNKLHKKSI